MDQATSGPEPQPNGSHANHCSIGRVIVCVLVLVGVICLCFLGGRVFLTSSSAPGQSALNQGEGKVAVLVVLCCAVLVSAPHHVPSCCFKVCCGLPN